MSFAVFTLSIDVSTICPKLDSEVFLNINVGTSLFFQVLSKLFDTFNVLYFFSAVGKSKIDFHEVKKIYSFTLKLAKIDTTPHLVDFNIVIAQIYFCLILPLYCILALQILNTTN